MAPLVSVIVPVYNVSPYLRQCMDSIVNQTLKDIEIICVDDGSTDDSLAILQEYAEHDSRITILQQENKGGGAARNLGMTKATGKYLSFLDSDDFFDKEMLDKAVDSAEKYTAEVTVFGARIYNNSYRRIAKSRYGIWPYYPHKMPFSSDELIEHKISCFGEIPWNKLYYRSYIERNNLKFMEIRNCNDLTFVLQSIFFAEKIVVINESLMCYRVGIKTNTQSNVTHHPLNNYIALIELRNRLTSHEKWQKYEIFFVNHALQSCIGYLNRYQQSNYNAYIKTLIFFCKEGFEKLGINKLPKRSIKNKWIYRQYMKYLSCFNENYKINQYSLSLADYLMMFYFTLFGYAKEYILSLKLYGVFETLKSISWAINDLFVGIILKINQLHTIKHNTRFTRTYVDIPPSKKS